MFDKSKTITQAYKLQKILESEMIEVEKNGIKIVISGDQKIKSLIVSGDERGDITDIINDALKKARQLAALKIKEMIDTET